MNRITLFILVVFIFTGCKKDENNSQNHLPVAAFSIVPQRAEANDTIYFDAGIVSDIEDPIEKLEIQWSWYNNSIFTPYSTEKSAIYQYPQVGVYFPQLRVKDLQTLTDTINNMVVIVHDLNNLPPQIPTLITPPEWETWLEPTIIFKWKAGTDPESDSLLFDLWVGKSKNSMSVIRSNYDSYNIVDGERIYEVTVTGFSLQNDYYWQVAAKDPNGNYTRGHIWKFTTRPPQ